MPLTPRGRPAVAARPPWRPRGAVLLGMAFLLAAGCAGNEALPSPTSAAGTSAVPGATPSATGRPMTPAPTSGGAASPPPVTAPPATAPPLATLPPPAQGTPPAGATEPPLPSEPVEPVPDDSALTPALQRLLDQWQADDGAPGAVLGVRLADGSTAVVAAGETDTGSDRAVDPGHRFRAGSITKTFVATLLVRLASEGLLALDDPLARHLPEAPHAADVTLRQLLDHTSGIPDFAAVPDYRFALLAAPGRDWQPDEVVGLVEGMALDFEPGRGWGYSNTNYVLLGLVAERVTGMPLADLLRRHISRPLGLASTYLDGLEVAPGPAVSGHFDLDGDGQPDNVRAIPYTALVTSAAAAGGISASALDLLDFAGALFDGTLVGRDGLAEMMTIAPSAASYGAGLAVFEHAGVEVWGHSGALPGFATLLVHSIGDEVTVVAMANETGADVRSLVDGALALALEQGR